MSSPTTRSEMQPRTNAVPFIINVSSIRNLPTPVELKSFTAVMTVGGVRVSWVTAVEWENLGFNVYRSSAANGVRTQINNGIIPAVGASSGSAYEWLDTSVQAGTYYYWLEDVSDADARTRCGGRESNNGVHVVGEF